MKNLSRKQFNRLTSVQKVGMALEAFNGRIERLLNTYELFRQKAESEEEARACSEILSVRLEDEFNMINELLSKIQESAMYHLCQHYGATDSNFRAEIDRKYPSDELAYWTGKKLNKLKYTDINEALDMIVDAFDDIKNNPLQKFVLNRNEVNQ